MDYTEFVTTAQGTDSEYIFSNGNTLPLVGQPWGMTSWSPQTADDRWFFTYRAARLQGIRATHQPSPWIGDYGHFLVTPQQDAEASSLETVKQKLVAGDEYDKRAATFRPSLFRCFLKTQKISVEVTATERCGFLRFTFPRHTKEDQQRVVLQGLCGESELGVDFERRRVRGYTRGNSGGVPPNFAAYFVAEFDTAFAEFVPFLAGDDKQEGGEGEGDRKSWKGERMSAYVAGFERNEEQNDLVVTCKVATSFISYEQALTNLALEIGDKSWDEIESESRARWNELLGRVTVVPYQPKEGEPPLPLPSKAEKRRPPPKDAASSSISSAPEEREEEQQIDRGLYQQRTFYCALYRALLFPRMWYEYESSSQQIEERETATTKPSNETRTARKPIHFSPYNGKIEEGVLYTDNGFWDTYRTVYPLLSILAPSRLAEMLQGWTRAALEGDGWFPKWASPGFRDCMIGTHIDVVMADALVKGVFPQHDIDNEDDGDGKRSKLLEVLWNALLKDATEEGDVRGRWGRKGFFNYLKQGWVACDDVEAAACRTMDFALDDFAVAQVGKILGKPEEDRRLLLQRSLNYKNTFDLDGVGMMRGRKKDGSWEPFDQFRWGGPYVEGSAWQHSWGVPHDPQGLIELHGGREAFCAKLDQMMSMQPTFTVGTYGFEIHEMTEMAAVDFGQYAHSNQPVHHVLYLYTCAGQPWKTQYWVRRIMDELYAPTPDGLPVMTNSPPLFFFLCSLPRFVIPFLSSFFVVSFFLF
ncbi:Alpha-mannosidase [Balamuthia mandrillaris]